MKPNFICQFCLCLTIITNANTICAQQTWPQFRGEDGTGIARDSQPLVKFDLKKNLKWETEIPGVGWSSPVHDGQRIWMTTAVTVGADANIDKNVLDSPDSDQTPPTVKSVELRAICADLETGKLLHNVLLKTYPNPANINPLNSYASPTPAIADGKVICHFGSYGTWCLNVETAEPIWDKQLVVDHSVGPGSSPMIIDGKVILVCDGIDKQFIAALDLKNGEQIWRTHRPAFRQSDGEQQKAYSTPLLIEVAGKQQLIIPAAQWLIAYDPGIGTELWRLDHGDGFSVTPMATYESGLIVFATGYGQPEFVAVDPTGSGDVTETHLRWRAKSAPAMSSLIGDHGRIYATNDKGIVFCLDAKTGEVLNRARITGSYSASPLLANGNLYFSNRDGLVSVVGCSTELKTLAEIDLGSALMASPAVFGNDLIFRSEQKLFRIK